MRIKNKIIIKNKKIKKIKIIKKRININFSKSKMNFFIEFQK